MSQSPPTLFTFDAARAVMVAKTPGLARTRFVDGDDYLLLDVEERSAKSHDHEFAWLNEAWKTLPESLAEQYPTPEHLRKKALIQARFYHETVTDAGSNAAALRVASMIRAREEFAMVFVRGAFVIVRDPKSQSRRAMEKDEFQRSKTAILEVVSELLGVLPETLSRVKESA